MKKKNYVSISVHEALFLLKTKNSEHIRCMKEKIGMKNKIVREGGVAGSTLLVF